ncbi:hypothetical protein V2O64_00905 [Verrucomicrobiaceae bacterium 227]
MSGESKHIGGLLCQDALEAGLMSGSDQKLTPYEEDALWAIFQEIGRCWRNLYVKATDSANLKSSWLDFVLAKTDSEPNYVAEYSNAVVCVDELIEMYGRKEAFRLLFLENGIPKEPPVTRLAHVKKYVIDEFIRVNIVASGFKSFGAPENRGLNYKGYLGGSRYNLHPKVRQYREPATESE